MRQTKATTALVTLALALAVAGSRVHGAVPAATTVNHAIAGQGKLAVSWNAVAGATGYQLWVEDTVGVKIMQLIAASTAGCASGTGVCSVFSDVVIVPGPFYTRVASWNPEGFAAWSPRYDAQALTALPRVLDANNKFLGVMVDPQRVFRPINGKPTEIVVIGATLAMNSSITMFYTLDGCAGTTYTFGSIPDRLEFTNSLVNGYLRSGTLANRQIESVQTRDGATNAVSACDSAISQVIHTMPLSFFNATTELGGLVGPFKAVY